MQEMRNPKSKPTDIRYTPRHIIEPVRRVLGTIDLDPATSTLANQTVKAKHIFTEQDNGLDKTWFGNVWLNWPASKSRQFAEKLSIEKRLGRSQVKRAAVMLFNWDHSTQWFDHLNNLDPVYVLFNYRVKFPDETGKLYEVGRSQAIAFIRSHSHDDIGYDVCQVYKNAYAPHDCMVLQNRSVYERMKH